MIDNPLKFFFKGFNWNRIEGGLNLLTGCPVYPRNQQTKKKLISSKVSTRRKRHRQTGGGEVNNSFLHAFSRTTPKSMMAQRSRWLPQGPLLRHGPIESNRKKKKTRKNRHLVGARAVERHLSQLLMKLKTNKKYEFKKESFEDLSMITTP